MSSPREPIGVVGTGYVGLVSAAGFAELGNEVHCIDIDAGKIERLKAGEIPIYEPGLAEMVERNRERMRFSTDIGDALRSARLLFVAVGTPPTYSGDADLSAVDAVVGAMPASDTHALVMKSTVPVGTGRNIKRLFAEQDKTGFRYVSCPEFLKEGSAIDDFMRPDRVVVGDDGDWAGDAVVDLYRPLLTAEHGGDGPGALVRTDTASAEMVKLAANAFLATKISFINEIANVCEETGADVVEVARGMGLDGRIGPKFLQAGVGFGGSCLAGAETVLVRMNGRTTVMTFERLWQCTAAEAQQHDRGAGVLEPEELEVLAWRPERTAPEFMPVMALTRRQSDDLYEVSTKMGRRVRCTGDHPFVVSDASGMSVDVKLARELDAMDWLPIATGRSITPSVDHEQLLYTLAALELSGITDSQVIVQPEARHLAGVLADQARILEHPRGAVQRSSEIRRTGTLRKDEAALRAIPLEGARASTTTSGNRLGLTLVADTAFWRIAGLYLAEGNLHRDETGGERLAWSFHPTREEHLVDEVVSFWLRHGLKASVDRAGTAVRVTVRSRLLGSWWVNWMGFGRTSCAQRLPDLVWEQSEEHVRALLSGMWEGDGSWSLVNGGPSIILEYGTISDELADGVLRLLAQLGLIASHRVGRVAKSTKDTHWLRVSGAEQVERALFLVPARDRAGVEAAIARQSKRIAPTGYRTRRDASWVRVTAAEPREGTEPVYSMEVPGACTYVTSGSLVSHNCFPKDVMGLKQLAGNSGYHFQLLSAVIEVNELQKRRVIGKLLKHLGGTLVGRKIALLGLAFKPNTDDMREATSLVLTARMQAAGASVSAYDPVAEEEARKLIRGVRFAESAMDAVDGADAVVLVTEWGEFKELDWSGVAKAMRGTAIIDGRNALDAGAVRAAGLTYEGIGRA
ncbi:MAG: nucleotide sugar dehydrogenase [Actinomycetota bacterium]|nr:nucleotide sugar dehydrogenase [Actinomycetota bacterium]